MAVFSCLNQNIEFFTELIARMRINYHYKRSICVIVSRSENYLTRYTEMDPHQSFESNSPDDSFNRVELNITNLDKIMELQISVICSCKWTRRFVLQARLIQIFWEQQKNLKMTVVHWNWNEFKHAIFENEINKFKANFSSAVNSFFWTQI
jgi:hypothetical protein